MTWIFCFIRLPSYFFHDWSSSIDMWHFFLFWLLWISNIFAVQWRFWLINFFSFKLNFVDKIIYLSSDFQLFFCCDVMWFDFNDDYVNHYHSFIFVTSIALNINKFLWLQFFFCLHFNKNILCFRVLNIIIVILDSTTRYVFWFISFPYFFPSKVSIDSIR